MQIDHVGERALHRLTHLLAEANYIARLRTCRDKQLAQCRFQALEHGGQVLDPRRALGRRECQRVVQKFSEDLELGWIAFQRTSWGLTGGRSGNAMLSRFVFRMTFNSVLPPPLAAELAQIG